MKTVLEIIMCLLCIALVIVQYQAASYKETSPKKRPLEFLKIELCCCVFMCIFGLICLTYTTNIIIQFIVILLPFLTGGYFILDTIRKICKK